MQVREVMQVHRVSPVFRVFGEISVPRAIPAVKDPKEMQVPWDPREIPDLWDLWVRRETLAPRDPGESPVLPDLPAPPGRWVPRA